MRRSGPAGLPTGPVSYRYRRTLSNVWQMGEIPAGGAKGFDRQGGDGIIRLSAREKTTHGCVSGLWKGSLLASAEDNRVSVARFAGLVLALCLFPGCASRRSATDLYRDALSLREAGKDRSAADMLNKAIKADPALAAAYAELGKVYEELGESDKALASFRQAAKLEPSSFENQVNLAKAYEKSDKPLQAAIAYGRAVSLDPNDFDALAGAAACCVKAGQYAKAQAYCEQAPPD